MRHHRHAVVVCLFLACTRRPINPDGETGSSGPATADGSSTPTTAGPAETSTTQSDPTVETAPPTGYAMTGDTECGYGAGPPGDSCDLRHYCDDGSFDQSVLCDSKVCTCFQDGVEFRQCPNNGLCSIIVEDLAARNELVNACCGFMWYVG